MEPSKRAARFDGARANAENLTSLSGTAALRELADRLGLSEALGEAAGPARPRGLVHDPGAMSQDVMVVADGDGAWPTWPVIRRRYCG